MVRSITGVGAGKGPYIVIHDGFNGISSWQVMHDTLSYNEIIILPRADFLPNSDRIVLDTHPYFAFSGDPNTDPLSSYETRPCNAWAEGINGSQVQFGVTVAGEFSNAVGFVFYTGFNLRINRSADQ
ncbi:MAG TPA: hypothetical protein VGO47_02920 [Chlamydiales bacterium]|nr:hypothetical protein [Chlamydiales bacterium]